MLTQSRLKELLHYNPETGIFTRIVTVKYNARIGDIAGCKCGAGYLSINIDRKLYTAHRLVWLYIYGNQSKLNIDHINGNKTDNKLSNLREATTSQNMQNLVKSQRDSKTGVLGVSFSNSRKKYIAQISIEGRNTYLGGFSTIELARQSYLKAKRKFHSHNTL